MSTRTPLATALLFGLTLVGVAPSCIQTQTQAQAGPAEGEVIFSDRDAQWLVRDPDGRALGYLLRFVPRADAPAFHTVVTPHLQDVGLVDALGRWWRYAPHQPEPELVGTGTVREGVEVLLGASGEPELEPLESLPEPGGAQGQDGR